MHLAQQPTDGIRRLPKPAEIVKWYREIKGFHRDQPLPPNVSYKEMLAVVIEHDSAQGGSSAEQSVA